MILFLFVSLSLLFNFSFGGEWITQWLMSGKWAHWEKYMWILRFFATRTLFFQTTNFPVEQSEKHIVLKSKSNFANIKKEQKIYSTSAKSIAQNIYSFEIFVSAVKYFVSPIQKTSMNYPSLLKSLIDCALLLPLGSRVLLKRDTK